MKIPKWDTPNFLQENTKNTIDYFLVGNIINYAFTDFVTKEKWEAEFNGKWPGAYGMWAALTRAMDEGINVCSGYILSHLSLKDVENIFRGNCRIPMLEDRLRMLRETGQVLVEKYDGHFFHLVEDSKNKCFAEDGSGLVDRLTFEFPSYEDKAVRETTSGFLPVTFNKRAQLAPAMLAGRFGNSGLFHMEDLDELTVFADYNLPKALRSLGILKYSDALAAKVDNQELIAAGSSEEIEMRALTIVASDILIQETNRLRKEPINALHVDYKLFSEGRKLPGYHHLTMTTAY